MVASFASSFNQAGGAEYAKELYLSNTQRIRASVQDIQELTEKLKELRSQLAVKTRIKTAAPLIAPLAISTGNACLSSQDPRRGKTLAANSNFLSQQKISMESIVSFVSPPSLDQVEKASRYQERKIRVEAQRLVALKRYEREVKTGSSTPEEAWTEFKAEWKRIEEEKEQDCDLFLSRSDLTDLASCLTQGKDRAVILKWLDERDKIEDKLQAQMEKVESLIDQTGRPGMADEMQDLKEELRRSREEAERLRFELNEHKRVNDERWAFLGKVAAAALIVPAALLVALG